MGDLLRPINWEMLRELNTADQNTKHFMGTQRCIECGNEQKIVQAAPLWAMNPATGECESCEKMTCLFVHPDDPHPDDAEPYDYAVILPEDRSR